MAPLEGEILKVRSRVNRVRVLADWSELTYYCSRCGFYKQVIFLIVIAVQASDFVFRSSHHRQVANTIDEVQGVKALKKTLPKRLKQSQEKCRFGLVFCRGQLNAFAVTISCDKIWENLKDWSLLGFLYLLRGRKRDSQVGGTITVPSDRLDKSLSAAITLDISRGRGMKNLEIDCLSANGAPTNMLQWLTIKMSPCSLHWNLINVWI